MSNLDDFVETSKERRRKFLNSQNKDEQNKSPNKKWQLIIWPITIFSSQIAQREIQFKKTPRMPLESLHIFRAVKFESSS